MNRLFASLFLWLSVCNGYLALTISSNWRIANAVMSFLALYWGIEDLKRYLEEGKKSAITIDTRRY